MLGIGRATLIALGIGACSGSKVVAPSASLTVEIAPPTVTADKNQTITLSVIVKDASGVALVPDSVRWSTSDATKATVSAAGVLRTIQVTTPTISIQAAAFKGHAHGVGSIPVTITVPVRLSR